MRWLFILLVLGCSTVKPDLAWRERTMNLLIEMENDARALNGAIKVLAPNMSPSDRAIIKDNFDWYTTHYFALLVALANEEKEKTDRHLAERHVRLKAAAKTIMTYAM
jgi:hypothetical protein